MSFFLGQRRPLTWPQMIQFWDVDLSAIHQKFLVNLPPKLEWYDLHSCSHEQKTKSVFVHHWNQISVNSVFYFLSFRKSHKKSHNLSTSSCNSCRKLLKLWGQTWNFNYICEHGFKLYYFNFGCKLTGNFWLIADKSTSQNWIIWGHVNLATAL